MLLLLPVLPFRGSRALVCRGCGTRIAFQADQIGEASAHVNPLGVECEVIRFSTAVNLRADDFSTAEHTWFEGYAWRPVSCAECGRHVGWRYEAEDPARQPQVFFGLLASALAYQA